MKKKYEPPKIEKEKEEKKTGGGNTRLPYGLCKKYGIELPEGATPRDAWAALKERAGITPERVYKDLEKGSPAQAVMTKKKNTEIKRHTAQKSALTDEQTANLAAFEKDMNTYGVKFIPAKPREGRLTDENIINEIAGGDLTKGSCVSVGLAYIAQKNGMYVTDFRGGRSQYLFSHGWATLDRVFDGEKAVGLDGFKITEEVLAKAETGKEYALVTGHHFAIIKKNKDGQFEYLELQSGFSNGYKQLTTRALYKRFSVRSKRTLYRERVQQRAYLIDIKKVAENPAFNDIIGYLNTDGKNEKKGKNGREK